MLTKAGDSGHGVSMGDGKDWDNTISNNPSWGYAVNGTAAAGAIAQWEANTGGVVSSQYGHVAYVESATSSSITISEDIYSSGPFRWRTISVGSSSWPSHFLHIKDASSSTGTGNSSYPDGSYISYNGGAYVIAGGAPLPISDWNHIGGPKAYRNVDQNTFASFSYYPKDGTFVRALPSGRNYEFAGGAVFYVSDWSRVGGTHTTIDVDDYAIDSNSHVRPYASDGTYIRSMPSGRNFVFAGGGPMYIASMSDVGSGHTTTVVDDWPIDNHHLVRYYPVDNTFVKAMPSGRNFVFAGGGPLYISDLSRVNANNSITVSDWTIDNHYMVQPYPVDGTIVNAMPRGEVYTYAGGSPVKVHDWANIGGVQYYTTVDQWPIDNNYFSLSYPKDGTYLQGYTSGEIYRSNGSSLSRVSSGNAITRVDDWAISNQLGGSN